MVNLIISSLRNREESKKENHDNEPKVQSSNL
jgi:hypothetical protein